MWKRMRSSPLPSKGRANLSSQGWDRGVGQTRVTVSARAKERRDLTCPGASLRLGTESMEQVRMETSWEYPAPIPERDPLRGRMDGQDWTDPAIPASAGSGRSRLTFPRLSQVSESWGYRQTSRQLAILDSDGWIASQDTSEHGHRSGTSTMLEEERMARRLPMETMSAWLTRLCVTGTH